MERGTGFELSPDGGTSEKPQESASPSDEEPPLAEAKCATSREADRSTVYETGPQTDPVEQALARVLDALGEALRRTTDPAALVELSTRIGSLNGELEARRRARAGVVELASRKRGAK